MKKWTEQSAFTYVWKKIVKQGKPSLSGDEKTCLYRGPNGTRCAVGWLIPDSLYIKRMEGKVADAFRFQLGLSPEFLLRLQSCHDQANMGNRSFLDNFKQRMRGVAKERNLTCPE